MGNCQRASYSTPDRYRPCGDGRRRKAAIPARNQVANPFRRMRALANIDKGADHVAHHVVQEGAGAKVKDDAVAVTQHVGAMQ